MGDAFRRLARDGWVLGIAGAIAIRYAVVVFVRAVADTVVEAAEEGDGAGLLAFQVGGVGIDLRRVLTAGATLAAVVLIAAIALRRAEPDELDDEGAP